MNISLLEPLGVPDEVINAFAEDLRAQGHTFTYYNTKTTDTEELKRRSQGQDVVMIANNPYPAEVVESADALKLLAVAFTGIDHVGLDACAKKGVTVCNCAGYSDLCVAEQVLGMTIHMLRYFGKGDQAVRSGGTSVGLVGSEICGKTVGIIGCGRIGLRTAKLFQAFGANVIACARHEREEVKDLLAFLALVANQKDEIAFRRIINKPARGIGPGSQDKILLTYGAKSFKSLIQAARKTALPKKAGEGVKEFCGLMDSLIAEITSGKNILK